MHARHVVAISFRVLDGSQRPLRTVEDSKGYRDNMPGMHVKNLYLRDKKKRNYLLVAEEDRVIDLKSLHAIIGSDRLSFGSADRLFEMLGQASQKAGQHCRRTIGLSR